MLAERYVGFHGALTDVCRPPKAWMADLKIVLRNAAGMNKVMRKTTI